MTALPPLNALRAFEATARHLSFSRAAEELNVTPAAVSHQVKALEETLGTSLFRRLNRAIELTDAGRLLFPDLQEGFQRIGEAVAKLDRLSDDRVLVISTGPAFSAKWLAPRLYRFLEQYPEIDARISANLGRSNFGADGVDVAIRFGGGEYSGFHVEPLVEDSLLPLCSPALLARGPALKTPRDLRRHVLIHDDSLSFRENHPGWAEWLKAAGVRGVDASRGLRFNHADHGIDAAIEGAGVVLARKVMAAGDLRLGRLVAPFALEIPVGLAFYLVTPRGAETRPKTAKFRDWIEREMAEFRRLLAELPIPMQGAEPPDSAADQSEFSPAADR